jgi:endonuclease YncB( thermonuclease family)
MGFLAIPFPLLTGSGRVITILASNNTQHRIRLQGIDTAERKQPYGR